MVSVLSSPKQYDRNGTDGDEGFKSLLEGATRVFKKSEHARRTHHQRPGLRLCHGSIGVVVLVPPFHEAPVVIGLFGTNLLNVRKLVIQDTDRIFFPIKKTEHVADCEPFRCDPMR